MPVAVISGASRGLGPGLIRKLKDSHTIYAVCREASSELKSLRVHIIEGIDFSKKESFEKLKKALEGVEIDLLLNVAGIYLRDTFETLSIEAIEKSFFVNSIAPLFVTKTLSDQLNEHAKVLMMSSRMGSIGDASTSRSYAYRASKSALNMFGKCLSLEFKNKNISVLLVHPGSVRTDMNPDGQISTETSVNGILEKIKFLDANTSGKFLAFDERELPW